MNDPLDMDRDEKKLEAILALKQKTLTVRDLKIFVPFGINLDPYIKKVIRDEYVSLAALEGSATGFGWFTNTKGIFKFFNFFKFEFFFPCKDFEVNKPGLKMRIF